MNRTRTAAAALAMALFGVGLTETARAREPAKPAAATAQAPGSHAPVVTEARRREILQAARTLTTDWCTASREHGDCRDRANPAASHWIEVASSGKLRRLQASGREASSDFARLARGRTEPAG
jgi:hypothetical protein